MYYARFPSIIRGLRHVLRQKRLKVCECLEPLICRTIRTFPISVVPVSGSGKFLKSLCVRHHKIDSMDRSASTRLIRLRISSPQICMEASQQTSDGIAPPRGDLPFVTSDCWDRATRFGKVASIGAHRPEWRLRQTSNSNQAPSILDVISNSRFVSVPCAALSGIRR
jgi:hypothetical protein